MKEQKIYASGMSARQITFDSGKSILKLSINMNKFREFVQQNKQHISEKGYMNLGISERREVGQYGDTHCVWLDTWQRDNNNNKQNKPAKKEFKAPDNDRTKNNDDIPF